MINYILGSSGTGKTTYLIEKIRKVIDENGNKKIFVIMPEQFSFEYERKLCISLGAKHSNMITAVSFTRLAKLIFDNNGGFKGEYANDITKIILMYKVISELKEKKALLFFNKQSDSIYFIEEILDLINDFRHANIKSDFFSSKIQFVNEKISEKAQDISLIYSYYEKKLSDYGYRDGLTDISKSAEISSKVDFFKNSIVFIDEFDSFSKDELELIKNIIFQSEDIYISMCTEKITKKDNSLFSEINKSYYTLKNIAYEYNKETRIEIHLKEPKRFISKDIQHLSLNLFKTTYEKQGESKNISIIESKDLYQEADFVCATIREMVRKGYKWSDFAVISRQLSDYESIFESTMDRYNIPYFSDSQKSIMHTAPVLMITSLLEITSANKIESEKIFKYIKTQCVEIEQIEISLIENYCYKWNVDGDMWLSTFNVDDNENKMDELRQKIINPIQKFKKNCENKPVSCICENIYNFLDNSHIKFKIDELMNYFEEEEDALTTKIDLHRVWDLIIDTLDALVDIYGGEKISLKNFKDLFTFILKQNSFLNIPQTLDSVMILSAEKARLNSPKISFIVGVNEGLIPSTVKSKGILNEKDKQLFFEVGLNVSKDLKELIADERLIAYRIFSASSEKLFLTYPLSDITGGARYPSYVLNQIGKMFSNDILKYANDFDIIYYSQTYKSAYYNYVQTFKSKNEVYMCLRKTLQKNTEYFRKIEYLDMVNENIDFTIKNKELINKLFTDNLNISATAFQDFNFCHFRYFCKYGLKLKTRIKKEINPLEQGNLIHLCLEEIFKNSYTKEHFLSLSKSEIEAEIEKTSEYYKNDILGGDFGKSHRFNANFKKITSNMTQLITHIQSEFSQASFVPIDFELKISQKILNEPIKLNFSNGVEIILNGKVDRVDVYENDGEKYIRIIDYKTGAHSFNLQNVIFGIDMQMLLYIFALTEKDSKYKDYFPAGILYMPSGNISIDKDEEKDIDDYINSFYKMKGVVLKNREVLNAMEEHIKGIYIPAKTVSADKGDGELMLDKTKSSYLSESQFEKLRDYAKKLIRNMVLELYDGNISANPLVKCKNHTDICENCEYWDICGNVPNLRSRIAEITEKESEIRLFGNEENENGNMD